MATTSSALHLGDAAIRQLDGLFSLNDLHVAAGGERRHQPAFFLRRQETQALIAELGSSANSQSLRTVLGKGKEQGTYACRELVIAYAAWISAAFHLKVIRVFLATQTPAAQSPSRVDQQRAMEVAMAAATAVRRSVYAQLSRGVPAKDVRYLVSFYSSADGEINFDGHGLRNGEVVGTWPELADILRSGQAAQADALEVAEAALQAHKTQVLAWQQSTSAKSEVPRIGGAA